MDDTKRQAREADVIVLGVGTCGEDLSLQLLDAGLEVIGIEASLVGGECAFWACIPSKIMIRAADALQETRRVEDLAGRVKTEPDWNPVAARVREATGSWDDSGAIERYRNRGGHLLKGRGRLTGRNSVTVGGEQYTARRGIVIATGSKPIIPPITGLDQVEYWTTHEAIEAEKLPESLIVLGGGVVGCELGQVFARFGVSVTIVEGNARLLPTEEPEASEVVADAFSDEGIEVHAGRMAQRVESRDGSIVVTLEGGLELGGERLLVATGRSVDLTDLGLEAAGLDSAAESLEVDERMRVTDSIWAMGDVTGKSLFTHVALYQSSIVAADILGKEHQPARYDAVPRGIFTDPEVGAVGMTEAEARDAGLDVVVAVKQLPLTFRGFIHGTGDGMIKLVADRESGVLVGATAAGPQAGEMLGMLTLAIHARVPLTQLQSMIYAFPTFHGGIGEAVGAWGRGVTSVLDPEYRTRGLQGLDEVVMASRGRTSP